MNYGELLKFVKHVMLVYHNKKPRLWNWTLNLNPSRCCELDCSHQTVQKVSLIQSGLSTIECWDTDQVLDSFSLFSLAIAASTHSAPMPFLLDEWLKNLLSLSLPLQFPHISTAQITIHLHPCNWCTCTSIWQLAKIMTSKLLQQRKVFHGSMLFWLTQWKGSDSYLPMLSALKVDENVDWCLLSLLTEQTVLVSLLSVPTLGC